MSELVGSDEKPDTERGRGVLLLELLRDKTMTLGTYKKRCEALGVHFGEFLRGGLICFVEIRMEGGEHEGKGAVSDREIGDGSLVALTDAGKNAAGFIRRVNDIFGRRRRPRRQRPQQLGLELPRQAS